MHALFATCAPGLEKWLQRELDGLGAEATEPTAGGVAFQGSDAVLYRVALCSGLTMALRVRIGRFVARRFDQIVRHVSGLDWGQWLTASTPVAVSVTARKSRLYHTGAVAERVQEGLRQSLSSPASADAKPTDASPLGIAVRLFRDECTVSLDVSGEPLYRRGYRLATAKAPLRPDLAWALLQLSGWSPQSALIDPFCGAGTICIEAAAMARRLPPGRLRSFAFMQAANFKPGLWADIKAKAMRDARPAPAPIVGSDRDAGAIAAATANAERAGVEVQWEEAPLGRASALHEPVAASGMWVSNPPYGRRTGDASRLLNLYQSIGHRHRGLPEQWRLALVVSDMRLARATGVPLMKALMTDHGGSKIHIAVESDATSGSGAES
ncbi:MAG: class I SAM-dependent RNA methyltransferase [Myxococcota bacterium]